MFETSSYAFGRRIRRFANLNVNTTNFVYCIVFILVASFSFKHGVHTNDFAPINGRRGPKLGHASPATVFRSSRLIFQAILRDNLEATVLRYQPITTAVIPDACLNTNGTMVHIYHRKKTHCGCLERVAKSGSFRDSVRGSVGAM